MKSWDITATFTACGVTSSESFRIKAPDADEACRAAAGRLVLDNGPGEVLIRKCERVVNGSAGVAS